MINSIQFNTHIVTENGKTVVYGGQRDPNTGLLVFLFLQVNID